jgi:hypothetical protein
LNIGAYDEVIYLTNDENVSEALTLKLTVTGEKPDWTVNPADFKYNMSVFGKMRFNNIFSADKGDLLAAFHEGKCIGVTSSSYDKVLDMWYALLTIYNNATQTGSLEFRMWDASTGKTYKATPSSEIKFVSDAIIGNTGNPVILDGKEILYQNIALTKGWNWMSFNLANSELSDVNKTLINGVWTNSDIVKSKDYFDSYSTTQKKWTGTLSSHKGFGDNTAMFMLLSSEAQTLSTSGTVINTKTTPITVKGKEWNYIGYLPSVNTTVNEALAGYDARTGDVIKSLNTFAMYSQNHWSGNLEYLEANNGYMLYRTADNTVTFTYPSVSGALSNTRSSAVDEQPELYINRNFAENMSVVATSSDLRKGDRILTYVNGNLRGVGEYQPADGQALSFITVAGNEANETVHFELQRNGKTAGYTDAGLAYSPNRIAGSIESPVVLDFGAGAAKATVYPSPFQKEFMIAVEAEKDAPIEIKVTDIAGRTLWVQNETASFTGTNTIVVSGCSSFATGVYIVRISSANVTGAYRIVKIK